MLGSWNIDQGNFLWLGITLTGSHDKCAIYRTETENQI